MKRFVCSICGYYHTVDALPSTFKCPLCRAPASKFSVARDRFKVLIVESVTGRMDEPRVEEALRPYIYGGYKVKSMSHNGSNSLVIYLEE